MNTMKELYEHQRKHNDYFPTRYEFMIDNLVTDYINSEEQNIIDKLSDWDGESTAEILSDVLKKLRLNKNLKIDLLFFEKLVDDKDKEETQAKVK